MAVDRRVSDLRGVDGRVSLVRRNDSNRPQPTITHPVSLRESAIARHAVLYSGLKLSDSDSESAASQRSTTGTLMVSMQGFKLTALSRNDSMDLKRMNPSIKV